MKDNKPKRLNQKERRKLIESVVGKVPWDKFTPGIYNYCDRWCEKCPSSKRNKCYLYWDTEKEHREIIKKGQDPYDLSVTFKSVAKSLKQTGELLHKIAEAEGLDMTITPEFEKECELKGEITDPSKEALYLESRKINTEIDQWLGTDATTAFVKNKNEFDNIMWHKTLIPAKIFRALHGKKEADFEKGMMKKFSLEDSQKTALVAYRSMMIIKESIEKISTDLGFDLRAGKLISGCEKIIEQINKELL